MGIVVGSNGQSRDLRIIRPQDANTANVAGSPAPLTDSPEQQSFTPMRCSPDSGSIQLFVNGKPIQPGDIMKPSTGGIPAFRDHGPVVHPEGWKGFESPTHRPSLQQREGGLGDLRPALGHGPVMHPGDEGYKPAFIKNGDGATIRNPAMDPTTLPGDNGSKPTTFKGDDGKTYEFPANIKDLKPGADLGHGKILGPSGPTGGAHGGQLKPNQVANPNYRDGTEALTGKGHFDLGLPHHPPAGGQDFFKSIGEGGHGPADNSPTHSDSLHLKGGEDFRDLMGPGPVVIPRDMGHGPIQLEGLSGPRDIGDPSKPKSLGEGGHGPATNSSDQPPAQSSEAPKTKADLFSMIGGGRKGPADGGGAAWVPTGDGHSYVEAGDHSKI